MLFVIVAVDDKGGIAREGKIPWNIREDLRFFSVITTSAPEGTQNAVIMGADTWNDIPYLKNRINIVVSKNRPRNTLLTKPGYETIIASSLETAIITAENLHAHDVYVIGGVQLIEEALKMKARVYLTLIHGDYNCDRKINFEYLHTSLQCVESYKFKTTDRNGNIPVDISFQYWDYKVVNK
jgi:dihydrofolate reductase